MEDLLDLYEQPYDPLRPVVCFDERPCQLIGEVLAPIPMKPSRSKRQNYAYQRHGTCCIFIAFEPLVGWRFVQVRERRTALDYAIFMKEVIERRYPVVDCICLVQDNLNTHTPGSFYEALAPEEAFHLARKLEPHYTPVNGSWLNMAEIELSALSSQCLDRRIGAMDTFEKEVAAWNCERNNTRKTVRWKFTKTEARKKLKNRYPIIHN